MVRESQQVSFYPDCGCKTQKRAMIKQEAITHESNCIGDHKKCQYRIDFDLKYNAYTESHFHSTVKGVEKCDTQLHGMKKEIAKILVQFRCGNGHLLQYLKTNQVITTDFEVDIDNMKIVFYCVTECKYNGKYLDITMFADNKGGYHEYNRKFSEYIKSISEKSSKEHAVGVFGNLMDVSLKFVCYACLGDNVSPATSDVIHHTRESLINHIKSAHTFKDIQLTLHTQSYLKGFEYL